MILIKEISPTGGLTIIETKTINNINICLHIYVYMYICIYSVYIQRVIFSTIPSGLSSCKWICAGFMSALQTVQYCALMRGVSGSLSHTHSSQRNLLSQSQTSPTLDTERQPSTQHMTVNTNTPTCTYILNVHTVKLLSMIYISYKANVHKEPISYNIISLFFVIKWL